MSCLELQRFIPVKSEDQLLEEAHLAVEKKEFLAGEQIIIIIIMMMIIMYTLFCLFV